VIALSGYTDRLSAAPGERVAFKVSSTAAGSYRASLARVVHADPNPAGPGVKIEDLAHRFAIERPSRVQPLALGSYARVDAAVALRTPGPVTVAALVSLLLFAIWGIWQRGFPEFSHAGLIR